MTKLKRTGDGGYLIKGKKYETLRGTRRQVYEYETAYKTAGGLLKEDLVQNDKGRIVSKAKFDDGPNLLKNLTKRGFFTKKGKFGHTKMKTRKLRKKLTRKNRRKMKGGASIQELKKQLGEVKKMIPNQIEEIKKNSAYEGAVEIAGEETFEKNLFTPLEDLNKEIEGPIKQIEDKINELESNFDEGKLKLKTEVETQFKDIKDTIKNKLGEIKSKIPGSSVPGWSMAPPGIAFGLVETGINKMIALKETDILKQIEELTPDDILNKAVETAEKTIEKTTEEKKEKAVEDAEKEEPDNEDAENPTDEAVKDIIDNLTPEQKKEYDEQIKNAGINAAEQFASDKKAAALLKAQFEEETQDIKGGKKKSKGKK